MATAVKKATPKKTTPKSDIAKKPDDKKVKIAKLLDELRAAQFPSKKKQIRRALRSLGHTGGLKSVDKK